MIVKVQYEKTIAPEGELPVVAKLIDCDEIIVQESKEKWKFETYKDNKLTGGYTFDVKSPVVAYIMEGGKTVDRLPRK